MTDEDMRRSPLSFEELRTASKSAHAFWKMSLECGDHTNVDGVNATVFSNGTVEIHCRTCNKLLGVLLLARKRQ